jgi:3-phosphoshikimate 1-carboxyvinyltransferase
VRSWRIEGPGRLEGSITVPGDKSIGQRAVLLAAIAGGPSVLRGLSGGLDNAAAIGVIEALGVGVRRQEGALRVEGAGVEGLRAPSRDLDAGNSGTTMRLAAGLLAPRPFGWRMIGDASLSRRPMRRVTAPLRAMGARIRGAGPGPDDSERAPLVSEGPPGPLTGIDYDSPVASAQVKSAILLAALQAHGPTAVREPTLSRDHTERMLRAMGAPLSTIGPIVYLDPAGWDRRLEPLDLDVPGDLSSAAFFLVGAAMVGGHVEVAGVGVNPTRTGLLEALRHAGVHLSLRPEGDASGEPVATVGARGPVRAPVRLGGELLTRAIDEFPILTALAAVSPGVSELRDAGELRVKESDRISTMAQVLSAFGAKVGELPDGLRIEGDRSSLRPARVTSRGDHRIAMSAAILALATEGESRVDDVECVDTSFPGFARTLRALGARVQELEGADA